MPITGRVDYTGAEILTGTPTGCWAMVGEDGNHYTQASNGSGAIQVGNAETNTLVNNISAVQLAADVLAVTGVSGWASNGVIPVPGTPYIGFIAGNFDGEVYGVFYKINASSLLELEGGFYYASATDPFGGFGQRGKVAATLVVGAEVYFFVNIEVVGGSGPQGCIAHVPYEGTNIDATPGSWDSRSTQTAYPSGVVGGARRYSNFQSLRHLGSGVIRSIGYYGLEELGAPDIHYNDIDTVAQTAPAYINISHLFPEVVADAGKFYNGSPSSSNFDDYTAPTINGDEVIFARPFTDNIDTIRVHRYTLTAGLTSTHLDTTDVTGFTITSVAGSLESARVYRDDDELLFALADRRYFYFAQITLDDDDEPEACDTEDEDDELPAAITWPKCDLVPAKIDPQAVAPTVSPGRSLVGHEHVVQPDAGHWRIALIGIAVWTIAAILQWRQIESTLDGRVGAILVPFYDAPLSGVAIVAAPDDVYPIGAVRIGIAQTAGATIRNGMHFSAGDWGYVLKRVFGTTGGVTSVLIWPPLRAVITSASDLEFNDPVVRCRLERDDGMAGLLELLTFGNYDVAFVEDV